MTDAALQAWLQERGLRIEEARTLAQRSQRPARLR
jgi:hypothetical protein